MATKDKGSLDRLDTKLDSMIERQAAQQATLEVLTQSVEHHVKRCDVLEDSLKPVHKHVAMVEGVLKLVALGATTFPLFEWLWRTFHKS